MITLKNILKWYGHFQMLTDCSTKMKRGEVVVVCGLSGSGKPALIKTVNGLEPVQQGEITVDGVVVNDKETNLAKLRSRVGMVFQHFGLFPYLSTIKNLTPAQVRMLKRSKTPAREEALKLLECIGLSAHADKFPAQLSGGRQQRVTIARALYMDPIAILFDEPTSALDPEMINEVLDVTVKLADEGVTMAVVTHEMGFTRKVVNRVIFMDGDKIVEDSPEDAFFNDPKSDRAKDFLAKILHQSLWRAYSIARHPTLSRFVPRICYIPALPLSQGNAQQGATVTLPTLLDCDPSHDDATAIVLALVSPELDVKAITSSAGNQTPEETLRNVLRVLTLLNRADIPVANGAAKPLIRSLIIVSNMYGENDLDDPALSEPTSAP